MLIVVAVTSCPNLMAETVPSWPANKSWDEYDVIKNYEKQLYREDKGSYYVYHIKTNYDLAVFAYHVRIANNNTEKDKISKSTVLLEDNIDMRGYRWRALGEIGPIFRGTFDGQNHTIKYLFMDQSHSGGRYQGMFDRLRGATVKNVIFDSCYTNEHTDDGGIGIVAGLVDEQPCTFENIEIKNCVMYVYRRSGMVAGYVSVNGNKFKNIYVHDCYFDNGNSSGSYDFGGLIGECSGKTDIDDCYVRIRPRSGKKLPKSSGGLIGKTWADPNITIKNTVVDVLEGFFSDNSNINTSAIVGYHSTGHANVSVNNVLVVSGNKIGPWNTCSLFSGDHDNTAPFINVSNCYVRKDWESTGENRFFSKRMNSLTYRSSSNIYEIWDASSWQNAFVSAVEMNRKGANFTVRYSVSDAKNCIQPVYPGSDGKLYGFENRNLVSSVEGFSGSTYYSMPSGKSYAIMAGNCQMTYTAKCDNQKWVIADKTTNVTDKKRSGKLEFQGRPTAEGEFKFDIVERPKIAWQTTVTNKVTHKVSLEWKVSNKDAKFDEKWKSKGEWHVYRNNVQVATLTSDKTSWIDEDPLIGQDLTYKVYFVSSALCYEKEDNKISPSYETRVNRDPDFKADEPKVQSGNVINTLNMANASVFNECTIKLIKWDDIQFAKAGLNANTMNINDLVQNRLTATVYTHQFQYNTSLKGDYQTVNYTETGFQPDLCSAYRYKWIIESIKDSYYTGKVYTSKTLELVSAKEIKITDISATKGMSPTEVVLKWQVDNKDATQIRYVVHRKEYVANDDTERQDWEAVYEEQGSKNSFSYTDKVLPGYIYRYCVRAYPLCEGVTSKMACKSSKEDIGFAASRGTIMGTINYNGGSSATKGVDVRLTPEEGSLSQDFASFAMSFGGKAKEHMPLAAGLNKSFWDGEWTLQFLVNPNPNNNGVLLNMPGRFTVNIKDKKLLLSSNEASSIQINTNTWSGNYVMLQHSSKGYRLGLVRANEVDGTSSVEWKAYTADESDTKPSAEVLYFGYMSSTSTDAFKGEVDEIRLWKGLLDDETIDVTYNTYISGNENNLMAYYTFDSGVGEYAFDSSHPQGKWNNRTTQMPSVCPVITGTLIPDNEVLSYRGKTNDIGEYVIAGIPYTGEGTYYNIVPQLGAHQFQPAMMKTYVSDRNLVREKADFTDVSSYKVEGIVYYEGTNVPVDEVLVSVDGVAAIADGAPVVTKMDGTFSIDVPIGEHVISVSKAGHDFSLSTYPSIGKHDFTNDVRDLIFWDNTKVKIAGRVAGGNLEYAKPLGVGASVNNIGTAQIVLTSNYLFNAERGQDGRFVPKQEKREFDTGSDMISSTAYAGEKDTDAAKRIVITTDAKTGEFSAMLPPAEYKVESIRIPSNEDVVIKDYIQMLQPANPLIVRTDSIQNEAGEWIKFSYNTDYKVTYYSQPTFDVEDITSYGNDIDSEKRGKGEKRKAFGERIYTLFNNNGTTEDIVLFEEKQDGTIDYKYKYPVFYTYGEYQIRFRGFEQYDNKENPELSQSVPMLNTNVEISNVFSIKNAFKKEDGSLATIQEDAITLDSLGTAIYQFQCGTPIMSAGDDYARTMTFTFVVNGVSRYSWPDEANPGMKGVVFGQIPQGNDFITAGPEKVLMVLRDPPGSGSSATWKKGSSTKVTNSYKYVNGINEGWSFTAHLGSEDAILAGAPGCMIMIDSKVKDDLTNKFHSTQTWAHSDGITVTTTAQTDISTSSDKRFDGPDADLFIGSSTNIIIGKAIDLHPFYKDGKLVLEGRNMNTIGQDFGTTFVYSQYDVINNVMPKLKQERNLLLQTDSRYQSKVPTTDPHYGEDGTYDWNPEDSPGYTSDSVAWYNDQINKWVAELKLNEIAKVEAIKKGEVKKNYTFTSSSGITESISTSNDTVYNDNFEWQIADDIVNSFGVKIKGLGTKQEITIGYKHAGTTDSLTVDSGTEGFSYSLKESGSSDMITVDVFDPGDGTSPIFYTRGGQTSGNWEPQQLTKFYTPKTEIMARTMKIAVPKISVENPVINNIPAGGTALFNVSLINESETKSGWTYHFGMDDGSNPNGAIVSTGGTPLPIGTDEAIAYNEPVKLVVELKQNDIEKLDHKVALILYDPSQDKPQAGWPANADTVFVEAHFVPASGEVALAVDSTYLNTKSDGKVTLTMSGYDLNRKNMLQMGLQFKSQGDQEWTTAKIWKTLAGCTTKEDSLQALTQAQVEYVMDLSDKVNYPEGTYLMRAYTMSQFGIEKLYKYSPEVKVYKDFTAPKLMGVPSPANGSYNYDSEISITFNEDIRTDKIMADTAQHVTLMGRLNNSSGAHAMSLYFDGGEGAYTEAQVGMPPSSFSMGVWMKWLGGAGQILVQDGQTKRMAFEIDETGHLMVCSQDTIVSKEPLLKDKWIHLAVTVDCTDKDNHKVTSSYAYGDKKVYLFRNQSFHKHSGETARVVIGKGYHGNMYDMTIWDYAIEDAKAHIYNTPKNQFTSQLIAYWPMIDGMGKVVSEMVGKRNLVMPDNVSWKSSSDNYSMRLEKEQKAYVDLNNVSTNSDDDYLVQMWFRKDNTASESDQGLLAWSSGNTAVRINGKDGSMYLKNLKQGTTTKVTDMDIRDGQWHHISLMVHKAKNGYANIYLDGNEVAVAPADDVDNLQGNLEIGGNFDGYVDELRIRHWDYTADMIRNSMLSRYDSINARQIGLHAYFPFEKVVYDEFNQPVSTFCVNDLGLKNCGKVRVVIPKEAPTPDIDVEPVGTKEVAPVLIEVPRLQRLNYTLSCDERTINIKIREDEDPALYQGCTLYATVYDVEDMAGNKAGEFTWSFKVDMKYIDWESSEYEADVTNYHVENSMVGALLYIKNMTGLEQKWTIEGVPSWMVINNGLLTGNLAGNETLRLDVVFNPTMPIGNNEGLLCLVDSRGISHGLHYNFTRVVNKPEWAVDPHQFKNSMNMVGQVVIDGVIQSNGKSILAAFDEEDNCIGICNPVYNNRFDTYMCFLTVYGNPVSGEDDADSTGNKKVRFRYFDVNTGKIYPSFKMDKEVVFKDNAVYGSADSPFKWIADGKEELVLSLEKGWNWVSLNVKTDTPDLVELFTKENLPKIREVVSGDLMVTWIDGEWAGDLYDFEPGTLYKVNALKPVKLFMVGYPAASYHDPIEINHGWNWLGANVGSSMSLDDAMADMSPEEGDLIKSQTQMATYTRGGWIGNLYTINAGLGYFYRSQANETKLFNYPTSASVAKSARANTRAVPSVEELTDKPDYSEYTGTMTVIAAVENKGVRVADCKVFATDSEGNIRAMKPTHDEDDRHLLYLVVHGEEETTVKLNLVLDLGNGKQVYETTQTLDFVDGESMGSPSNPYIISLDNITALDDINAEDALMNGSRKRMEDGNVRIYHNGKKYNSTGVEVK